MNAQPEHTCHLGVPDDEEPDGAPVLAWCTADNCGWTWTRPEGDRWADTLPPAWRAHRHDVLTRPGPQFDEERR